MKKVFKTNTETNELRLKANLTQDKLSELVGIPLSTIRKWDMGITKPSEHLLFLLEYYLRNEGYIKETENEENENT